MGLVTSQIHAAETGFNPAKPVMTKLKEGVYQYSQFFYNSLIVISEEGVVITDPSGAKRAADMRAEISKLTELPVTKVIYSHDHFDHSRGGRIFKDEGAQFITQEGCQELLGRDLENKVIQPDLTYKDQMRIRSGSKTIDLHYYGPNDGSCMSVIHLPEEKVLVGIDWHLPGYVNETHRLPAHNYVGILNTFKRYGQNWNTTPSSAAIRQHPHRNSSKKITALSRPCSMRFGQVCRLAKPPKNLNRASGCQNSHTGVAIRKICRVTLSAWPIPSGMVIRGSHETVCIQQLSLFCPGHCSARS